MSKAITLDRNVTINGIVSMFAPVKIEGQEWRPCGPVLFSIADKNNLSLGCYSDLETAKKKTPKGGSLDVTVTYSPKSWWYQMRVLVGTFTKSQLNSLTVN